MRHLLVFFISLQAAAFAWAGTDEAVALYEKKDYASAYTEFMRMAEVGDHQAQFNIGAMYHQGQHVAQDQIQAYAWIALAGQKNEGRWNELANRILDGLNDPQKQQAILARQALFEKFADDVVMRQLAPEIGTGGADPVRVSKRVSPTYPDSMIRARKTGFVEVLFTVAPDGTTRNHVVTSASNKDFVRPSLEAIKGWQYQPLLVNGRAVEMYGVEVSFTYHFEGTAFSEKQVRELIVEGRQKAKQGSSAERYRYAHFLEILPSYTSLKLDNSDLNDWYFKSAQEGYGPAQFSLGKNLLYGRACTADTAKSLIWLERSAAGGQPDSQYLLAIEMLSGARLARNPDSAVKWLQRAAPRNPHAQMKLAWLHATSADASWRNPALAKEYIDKINDDYNDHRTLFETRAAVAAAAGDFKDAVKWQKKSLAEAERYDLPLDGGSAKLAQYQAGNAWVDQL
jgi:TonB family protein